MADPLVLYVVTSVVLAGLVVWVAAVLGRAKDATPMEPLLAAATPSGDAEARAEVTEEAEEGEEKQKEGKRGRKARDRGKAKGPVIREGVDKPVSSSALVVALPTMRQRLDSHPEIDDGADPEPYQAPESVRPDPLSPSALNLATAMGRTDPASRKNNEDAFAIIDRHHLFVVADGAGRPCAEVSSQLAVDAIAATFDEEDPKPGGDVRGLSRRANRLRRAVLSANHKIRERSILKPDHAGMGASAVVVHFSPDNQRVHIAHVGEGRCYRVRQGAISLLTDRGSTPEGPKPQPDRLGTADTVEVDILVESPQPEDLYLVCSDGLSQTLKDTELLASVEGAETLEVATTRLVDRAKAKGEREDITAILVRVDGPVTRA
jgi:serine/threonine protein phosphatase PrpC